MAELTRPFRATVRERLSRDPELRSAYRDEIEELRANGEHAVADLMEEDLREVVTLEDMYEQDPQAFERAVEMIGRQNRVAMRIIVFGLAFSVCASILVYAVLTR